MFRPSLDRFAAPPADRVIRSRSSWQSKTRLPPTAPHASQASPRARTPARHGLTFVELMLAIAIMATVLGTLGAVGIGVQRSYEYTAGYGDAVQHARVTLERITRAVSQARANEQFPGFIVVPRFAAGVRLPETLVVWKPAGEPVDPNGLPRFNELVVYCPDPNAPNRLLEITVPGDTRVVPPKSDASAWQSEIANMQTRNDAQRVVLTELLRTAGLGNGASITMCGAVRFEQRQRPTDSELSQFRAGTAAWSSLTWPQGLFTPSSGVRQSWMRCEIQLIPGSTWVVNDPAAQTALPFFGSAAVYYRVVP